jgi:hypothetical protein
MSSEIAVFPSHGAQYRALAARTLCYDAPMHGGLEPVPAPNARGSVTLVHAALLASLAVAAVATYSGAALTWDGAALFFAFLDVQDLSLPHGRLSVALMQFPALFFSHHTTNVRALELVFGATYALVPVASLSASWLLLRAKYPRLIAWQFAWLCLGALPGQLFYVTESLIAVHVAWPLLFAVLTGVERRAVLPFLLGIAFLFELHPAAGLLFFVVGGAAAATALKDVPARRRLAAAALLLFAAGGARTWVSLHDPYELSQASADISRILQSLRLPHVALASAAVAPLALLLAHLVRPGSSAAPFGIVGVLYACFAAALLPWALRAGAWQDELNYRFVAPFAAAPFLSCAAVVALARPFAAATLTVRDGALSVLGTAIFALVLCVQCSVWLGMRRSLESVLSRSDACIPMNAVSVCRNTALRWWSTPSYALVIQGHAPRALLLPGNECRRRKLSRVVPVNPWYPRSRDTGWFDLTRTGRASE